MMTPNERGWIRSRDELINAIEKLGTSKELGYEAAKNLGSPKAMQRIFSRQFRESINMRSDFDGII